MGCPSFELVYATGPGSSTKTRFKAVNLGDAMKKSREFLSQIVFPTDRPGVSIKWAYVVSWTYRERPGKREWLVQDLARG